MSATREHARHAAIFYLIMGLPAVLSLEYLPRAFMVPGNATATAQRITDGIGTYRWLILGDLVSAIGFLFLAWSLYHLLEEVDVKQARLMVMLVLVSAAIGVIDVVLLLAPLIFLSGADFLSVFNRPQLEALAFGFLRLRGALLHANEAFWGLWLLPFGILVIRSGFIPKFIGAFLILGCFAYVGMCVIAIALPAYAQLAERVALPLAAPGELSMVVWLFAKGMRLPKREARLAFAG